MSIYCADKFIIADTKLLCRTYHSWNSHIKIEDEMGGECSTNGEKRNAYRILAGKPEGKRPLGRPRRRWEDNIKMDLREIEWGGMDWIDLRIGTSGRFL
jgi:hypothetical protein